MNLPKVSFGFVNCNRLHYLKSCVESLLECTSDYPNREFILVDNASVEEGTEEYLKEKEEQGFKVFRQPERDPSNEFARGLNLICEESEGDFVAPLQGDMQFIVKGGWLHEYVKLYEKLGDYIGCITFDAQRQPTILDHQFSTPVGDNFKFVLDASRPPIMGAADCMFSKKIIEMIYPWNTENEQHEGGGDSETKMLVKVANILKSRQLKIGCFVPMVPVSVAIYTDFRGTNARVRGNKRFGDYWAPKQGHQYYEYVDYEEALELNSYGSDKPYSIENIAEPIGFPRFVDSNGIWLKNPINPATANADEFVEL